MFHVTICYRNSTIQKWHDKTHLMSSKVGKGFDAFDQSVLKQIQQVTFHGLLEILCFTKLIKSNEMHFETRSVNKSTI